MDDPRHPNCQRWQEDTNGNVHGVLLTVHRNLLAPYELYSVVMIPYPQSGGRHVATVTAVSDTGFPIQTTVTMCWPYSGHANTLQHDECSSKTMQTPMDHVISEGYNYPNLGPYFIFLGTPEMPLSDIVGSIGLPRGQHVCFELVFGPRTDGLPVEEMVSVPKKELTKSMDMAVALQALLRKMMGE